MSIASFFYAYQKQLANLFFVFMFAVACFTFKDYGVSWDEDAQIEIGKQSFDYIQTKDPCFYNFYDKDYGVVFELPVYIIQQLFSTKESQYYCRHFCVHMFFLMGLLALFKSQLLIYHNIKYKYLLALLTILIIICSPRIYADSFFNSKDIILLSFSCLHFYTLLKYCLVPSKKQLAISGIATALLMGVRIIGLMNFLLTIIIIAAKQYQNNKINTKQFFINEIYYSLIAFLTLYIIWPYLYINPIYHFAKAFINMSRYRWDGYVLFNGANIKTTALPWYYSIEWISITTPIGYLICFVVGIIFIFKYLFTLQFLQIKKFFNSYYLFIICSLALGPILAVIIFHSVLYDAWRQLFYVYPYIICIAVFGIYSVISTFHFSKIVFKMLVAVIFIYIGNIGFFMTKNHPFGNVYFNEIMPKKPNYLLKTFERDYWGVSYKQALIQLSSLIKKQSDTINILCDQDPGLSNKTFLPENKKPQMHIYLKELLPDRMKNKMNYFVTSYRYSKGFYADCPSKIWSITVQGSDIISIYTLQKNNACIFNKGYE